MNFCIIAYKHCWDIFVLYFIIFFVLLHVYNIARVYVKRQSIRAVHHYMHTLNPIKRIIIDVLLFG